MAASLGITCRLRRFDLHDGFRGGGRMHSMAKTLPVRSRAKKSGDYTSRRLDRFGLLAFYGQFDAQQDEETTSHPVHPMTDSTVTAHYYCCQN
ncbi:hypothetical protein [Leptolyngbya sp. 7M]|uniref:hypothetical protein n=1 Tax=Leptolyngbya sp. 7M TaxID=2812896 RepID=UPI001B8ACB0A|nr:hypothetical protein [Leptolyngbya sp. 7M]QYO63130.1 hypothetical protein JVX88_24675 [Leptolyngbya sp. 7M]